VNRRNGWIVVPAYNEEQGLPRFIPELCRQLSAMAAEDRFAFTVLVIDDGSEDATCAVVEQLARELRLEGVQVRVARLTRNFGHQGAILAGMTEAAAQGADFIVTMDSDGEHPVELLSVLVQCWAAGDPIVHTARRRSSDLSRWKSWSSATYYRLLRRLSGIEISPGMADFKLWDGDVVRQIAAFLPTCGSTRAFAAWLAPNASVIPYDQRIMRRTSRFTSRKMWSLALNGLVRYSDVPLRLSLVVGIASLGIAALIALDALWGVITGRTVPGWASTIIAIAVFSGLQSFSLGILGEYLLRNSFRNALPSFVVQRGRTARQPGSPGVEADGSRVQNGSRPS
jgi:dolichol-phosphate mannosyltransferase